MAPQDTDFPPQHQERQPGLEAEMRPRPKSDRYRSCGKLDGRVAMITGGDSGIGRAVAIAFASYISGQVLHPNGGTVVNG